MMFQLVFGAFVCAYMMYSIYHSVKIVYIFNKKSKEFLNLNPNSTKVQKGIGKSVFICAFALIGFVMAIRVGDSSLSEKVLFGYRMTYACMGIVFLGLAVEVLISNTVYLSNSSFMCENGVVKYRNILRVENQGAVFKKKSFVIQNSESLLLSQKVGIEVEYRYLKWKKCRHDK